MQKTILYSLFFISLLSCRKNVSTDVSSNEVDETINALLQEALDDSYGSAKGVSVSILVPDIDLNRSYQAGKDALSDGSTLSAEQPFRIASITKTFVAASILRLYELDSLDIHDALVKHLDTTYLRMLTDGGYKPTEISILNCLQHTSGIFDYAMGGPAYLELCKANPEKRWTRAEQVRLAMESGEATGSPGEKYSYGDTGYILLGQIIESKMKSNLGQAMRNLLKFDQIELDMTWLESIDDVPSDSIKYVGRYLRGMDAGKFDPSIDLYGGGGLVSTTQNLANFIHQVFNGKVFDKESTLQVMLDTPVYDESYIPKENPRHKDYRCGLWKRTIYGKEAFMHFGLWGSQMIHLPAENISISINFTNGMQERLAKKLILLLSDQIEVRDGHNS